MRLGTFFGIDMNKTIWMCWTQGVEKALVSEQRKACLRGWEALNPDWNVRLISEEDACELLPEYKSVRSRIGHHTPQKRTNLVRTLLLQHYGGVWSDVDVMPLQPLDNWLTSQVVKDGMFAFQFEGLFEHERIIANWFLSSHGKGQEVYRLWSEVYTHSLLSPCLGTYFRHHRDFYDLYREHHAIKECLDSINVQKVSDNIYVPLEHKKAVVCKKPKFSVEEYLKYIEEKI